MKCTHLPIAFRDVMQRWMALGAQRIRAEVDVFRGLFVESHQAFVDVIMQLAIAAEMAYTNEYVKGPASVA